MKFLPILAFATLMVFGCAKKNIPSAPAVETAKEPDMMKMPSADMKHSKEAMAGMETYNAKCGRCHGLKNTADYTKEQWMPIMDRMAGKARLDSMEKANVILYVQANAKNS